MHKLFLIQGHLEVKKQIRNEKERERECVCVCVCAPKDIKDKRKQPNV